MAFYIKFAFPHEPLIADSPELEAAIQNLNVQHTWILYVYTAFVFFFFTFSLLIRNAYLQRRKWRQSSRKAANLYRYFRRWCVRKAQWPWTTRGHMLIIVGYILLNCLMCVMSTGPDLLVLQLARKTGWLSVVNFSFMLLMSMKNTPLAKLTGYSYERLNVFHRWIGGVAWIQGCVHTVAIGLATSRLVPDQSYILINAENSMGIAGLALWTITIFAFPLLKNREYEYFYLIHIFLWPFITLTLYMHNSHCQIPVLVGLGLVLGDRLIRTNRWIWHNMYAEKLKATLEPTSDGATLVTIPRGGLSWAPGSHAFINIPAIRAYQSHPFTIASVVDHEIYGALSAVQFIIRPKSGFTRALYDEARNIKGDVEKGRRELLAYVDGAYGGVPDFNVFDTIILIAAGSGITFTLPIALSIMRTRRAKSLHFIWSIRDRKSLEPVRSQLEEICSLSHKGREGPRLHMVIQLTGETKEVKPSKLTHMKAILTRAPTIPREYDLYGESVETALPAAPPTFRPKLSMSPPPTENKSHFLTRMRSPKPGVALRESRNYSGTPNHRLPTAAESIYAQTGFSPTLASPKEDYFGFWAGHSHEELQQPLSMPPASAFSDLLLSPLFSPPPFSPPPNACFSPVRGEKPHWAIPAPTGSPSASYETVRFSDNHHLAHNESWNEKQDGKMEPSAEFPPKYVDLPPKYTAPNLPILPSDTTPAPSTNSDQGFNSSSKQTTPRRKPNLRLNLTPSSIRKADLTESSETPKEDLLATHIAYGRPNIGKLIASAVGLVDDLDTVAVATCGVSKMVDDVRASTANLIKPGGPSISIFCEEFGW